MKNNAFLNPSKFLVEGLSVDLVNQREKSLVYVISKNKSVSYYIKLTIFSRLCCFSKKGHLFCIAKHINASI